MGSIKLWYSFLSILLPVFCFFFFKFILAALSTWQASHIPEQGANRMNIFKTRKGAFMILKKNSYTGSRCNYMQTSQVGH